MDEQRTFFKRLKKLFQTRAIVTVDKDGKRKVFDTRDTQQTNLSGLRDRYTKIQKSYYEQAGGAQSMAYQQIRREVFRDYDAMDQDPIIASALDIYADECLSGETNIPLLNGKSKTLRELHDENYTDFWIYGLDDTMNFKPIQAEKVACNGVKPTKILTLEDGTEIQCTNSHIWIQPDGSEVYTEDLEVGDSIKAIPTKISDGNLSGTDNPMYNSGYKIVSIKNGDSIPVYDIVNAGDNHRYAIETNDGSLLYTHNCTLKNEFGETISITSDDDNIRELLENLFYDILNIEFNLWPWVRNMTKYGDFFLGLEIGEGVGIVNVSPYSVYNTERLEGTDPSNPNVVKYKIMDDPNKKEEYEQYEIAHFRLLSDTNWLPYGKAMIENARRLWKQLSLMEDAMLIHRIMRAPEKRVFKIDIGNIPQNEVENYMQRIINKMKKVPFIDKSSGDYNLKYNMQNLTEDFYLPVRGGDSGTQIDSIGGLQYSAIEDIDYLKNKLFAALKIPKAYLGYEEDVQGKATLAAEDVRFARTIERIQRTIISELNKIAIIHLYGCGIDENKLNDFKLELVNPSTIYEQEKVNLWMEKVRLAEDIKNTRMLSKDWIYKNIFKLSDHEQLAERGKVVEDVKDKYRYEQIEMEGNDPVQPDVEEDEPENGMEQDFQNFNSSFEASNGDVGRPREGGTYKKDKHPYGRDPLGDSERTSTRSRTSEDNVKEYIKKMKSDKKRKKIISENDNNSMLNEDRLLENKDI